MNIQVDIIYHGEVRSDLVRAAFTRKMEEVCSQLRTEGKTEFSFSVEVRLGLF